MQVPPFGLKSIMGLIKAVALKLYLKKTVILA